LLEVHPHISHQADARGGITPMPDKLYIISVLSNPLRWGSRYTNFWDFQKHIAHSGAELITVELAQGDRPFEVTGAKSKFHLQLRTRDEMFHKENLGNLGCRLLPLDAKYVAFIDADMIFTRPDWVQETIHQLQHYDVVQMFSTYSDLDGRQIPSQPHPSFMYNYMNFGIPQAPAVVSNLYGDAKTDGKYGGAPGGAWAYRVEALTQLGGLMDRCILGSGDWHMAVGLVQKDVDVRLHPEMMHCADVYRQYIRAWQDNAARLDKNVGYVEAHMVHKFHGPRKNRFYGSRWQILKEHNYNPYLDIQTDHQGVYMWSGLKQGLRDDVRRYLRSRNEDATE
jgi:hypothetical protein